jgi:signal transduction histidine kinase
MRLARKLTVVLLVGIVAVFAVDTFLIGRLYAQTLNADLRHDHRVLARALRLAASTTWLDRGEAEARKLVAEANEREGQVRIRWVRLDVPPGSSDAPDLDAARIVPLLARDEIVNFEGGTDGARSFYTYTTIPGDPPAALELFDNLADVRAFFDSRARLKLLSFAAILAVCGLLTWIAGLRLVGRPVQQLVEKARRIGAGNFGQPLLLRRRDELSELAGEMNAMAQSLDTAGQRLQQEAAARLEALQQLRHAERLATVGKLAAGIAHELGTPLNVVGGRAKMIARGELEAPGDVALAARIIGEQTARMAGIVRQLLDFARRRTPEKKPADLGALAQEAAALLRPLAARQNVGFELVDLSPCPADVDAAQIQQVLTNLLMNAIQASPRGARVRVEASTLRCRGPSGAEGDYACLAVRDEGPGIPPEDLPHLFDPFFTTKAVGEGTGLGLSVSYGIVEEHGGWIDVQSQTGAGSCFRVFLPRGSAA